MPFFWVAGPQSLLGCLYTGNTIVTQPRNDRAEALELVERERCTSLSGWTSAVEQLRAHPDFEKRDLSSLLAPPPRLWSAPSSKGDPINLGMTETFGPQFNRQIFEYKIIARETGEVLPDGEEGEFCVRGYGLMHAIYKKEREEILDADGYYHTGDRGYIENGRIFFTGRYSEMVKAGGANVAPVEVEQTLMSLPGVRQAFVFGLPHPERGQEVAAVVVPEDGHQLTPEGLRTALHRELSAYKVPTRIDLVAIDEVPWLPTGKPDKRSMIAARTPVG
jgi:acyl-CoA synthetase (AMP-forming)/AMP-acid ligase II